MVARQIACAGCAMVGCLCGKAIFDNHFREVLYIMNIYESFSVLESEAFLLRLAEPEDCDDLLRVYSDKNALPFFNSDNCDGDNLDRKSVV